MELGGWVCHGVFEIFSDWTGVSVFFFGGGEGWAGNETKKPLFLRVVGLCINLCYLPDILNAQWILNKLKSKLRNVIQ